MAVQKKKKVPLRKLAIVGTASSSRDKAPYDDPEFEIWGLAWRFDYERTDVEFDIHKDLLRPGVPPDYFERLTKKNKPIYLIESHELVLKSFTYPLDSVTKFLEDVDPDYANGDYFASSINYMLGFAMLEGYKEIHLYGVDLIDDDEYAYQRPATEYYIGLARGLGIKVYIPETSALCKFTHRYGYELPPKDGIINTELLEKRIAEYKGKMEKALATAHTHDGAMQEAMQLLQLLKHEKRGRQPE